jgi:hypothetical protein
MGKIITILFISVLGVAAVAPKKADVREELSANISKIEGEEMDCVDSASPYIVLSKKDKRRLEQIINEKNSAEQDPNLLP